MTKKIRGVLILAILPLLLIADGAFGQQTTAAEAVGQARKGEYMSAAAALEKFVNSGNVTSSVVEGLYYSWIRKGEYVKARKPV